MNNCDHTLFLIEFIIDKITIPYIRAVAKECLPLKTVVTFQILDLPLINIQQDDNITSDCKCLGSDTQIFRKAKSCLFALPSDILKKPVHTFPVTVSVKKLMPYDTLPDIYLLGKHVMQLESLINFTLAEFKLKKQNPSKALKDTFDLQTDTGQKVGQITLFVRVSCLGNKIVTQFHIPRNKRPYLFKGLDESPIFQCKKVLSEPLIKEPICICKTEKSGQDGAGEEVQKTCCKPEKRVQYSKPIITDEITCSRASREKNIKDETFYSSTSLLSPQTAEFAEIIRKCGCPVKHDKYYD